MAAQTESRGGGGGEVKKLLSAVNDHYGCVIVHVTQHMDPATFVSSLTSSIAHWKLQGKKGVSIRLPIERVNLVEAAVKVCGSSPLESLMRCVHSNKHCFPFSDLQSWVGEDIFAAAVREVKEETGIDSEFVEVVTVRYELYEVLVYQLGGAMCKLINLNLTTLYKDLQSLPASMKLHPNWYLGGSMSFTLMHCTTKARFYTVCLSSFVKYTDKFNKNIGRES